MNIQSKRKTTSINQNFIRAANGHWLLYIQRLTPIKEIDFLTPRIKNCCWQVDCRRTFTFLWTPGITPQELRNSRRTGLPIATQSTTSAMEKQTGKNYIVSAFTQNKLCSADVKLAGTLQVLVLLLHTAQQMETRACTRVLCNPYRKPIHHIK